MAGRVEIAIAVVRLDDQVLVGRRAAGQSLEGFHEFPGGKRIPPESLAETARRECGEEAGLDVHVGVLVVTTDFDYPHGKVALSFFDCRPCDPVSVPREPFVWVPVDQLVQLRFPPANQRLLDWLHGQYRLT